MRTLQERIDEYDAWLHGQQQRHAGLPTTAVYERHCRDFEAILPDDPKVNLNINAALHAYMELSEAYAMPSTGFISMFTGGSEYKEKEYGAVRDKLYEMFPEFTIRAIMH